MLDQLIPVAFEVSCTDDDRDPFIIFTKDTKRIEHYQKMPGGFTMKPLYTREQLDSVADRLFKRTTSHIVDLGLLIQAMMLIDDLDEFLKEADVAEQHRERVDALLARIETLTTQVENSQS